VEWILKPLSAKDRDAFQAHSTPTDVEHGKTYEKSLDTSIMDLADDIAYGVHDFEDGIRLGLITDKHWREINKNVDKKWAKKYSLLDLKKSLFMDDSSLRKRAIGGMVNALIVSTKVGIGKFQNPIVKYRVELDQPARKFLDTLRNLVNMQIIKSPEVQTLEYRGQQIVMQLFDALSAEPERLMKKNFITQYRAAHDDCEGARVVCDYIAGMTDEYATRLYERLFTPRQGTIFTKL
jgi:dGTPase